MPLIAFEGRDVIALAAVIAGAAATITATVMTGRNQRELLRDARIAERRSDTYTRVAAFATRALQHSKVAFPGIEEGHPFMPPELTEEELWDMHAQVAAFASDDVRRHVDDVLGLRASVRNHAHHAKEVQGIGQPYSSADIQARTQSVDALASARERLAAGAEALIDAVRAELG